MRHIKQPRWSRDAPAPSASLITGWYGVIQIGDGWKPVTSPERAATLFLPGAIEAGATHIGYWSGRGWQFVEAIG